MSSHLTLVVNNSAEAPKARRSTVVDIRERARFGWVHRLWKPKSRGRALRTHPAMRALAARMRDDRGAVTAEYAIVILAAVAFAGLLVAIMRSEEIRQMLVGLVQNALGSAA